jgi:poly(3-hydroxybutyrate) depolymerase
MSSGSVLSRGEVVFRWLLLAGAVASSGCDDAEDRIPSGSDVAPPSAGATTGSGGDDAASGGNAEGGAAGGASGAAANGGVGTTDGGVGGEAGSGAGGSVPGCSLGTASFAGTHLVTVAGKERRYLVQLPAHYDPTRSYPVLFGLHGAGGNGESFASYFPLAPLWRDKAILVFPSALFYELDNRTTWRFPTDENLAFFDAMVAELSANLCVDRSRIFASGFSSGGFFSNTLGCRRGDVVRAIVPVAGGDRDFNDLCVGHAAVMVISSPLDTSDPTGGPAGISHHERGLRARDYFRERNGCMEATETVLSGGCVQYQGCLAGSEVVYCEHGAGHGWPSSLHAPASEFLDRY